MKILSAWWRIEFYSCITFFFFLVREALHNIGNEDLLKNKLFLASSVNGMGILCKVGTCWDRRQPTFPLLTSLNSYYSYFNVNVFPLIVQCPFEVSKVQVKFYLWTLSCKRGSGTLQHTDHLIVHLYHFFPPYFQGNVMHIILSDLHNSSLM